MTAVAILLLKSLLEFKLQSHRDRKSHGLKGKKLIYRHISAAVTATTQRNRGMSTLGMAIKMQISQHSLFNLLTVYSF